MTKIAARRRHRLLPYETPRYVRCYDNGGYSTDRYTVVFTGRYPKTDGQFLSLHMSDDPFHPQGVALFREIIGAPDVSPGRWGGPAIGRESIFGTRIEWVALPINCQRAALIRYKRLWNLS